MVAAGGSSSHPRSASPHLWQLCKAITRAVAERRCCAQAGMGGGAAHSAHIAAAGAPGETASAERSHNLGISGGDGDEANAPFLSAAGLFNDVAKGVEAVFGSTEAINAAFGREDGAGIDVDLLLRVQQEILCLSASPHPSSASSSSSSSSVLG